MEEVEYNKIYLKSQILGQISIAEKCDKNRNYIYTAI